ncbi:MlaD family protein [Rhodoferax sp.]|uniref:MlaD family protein n=1 Tax=Rhodoferax sp. TaxID=50421 RepID=UPI002ACE074A|nr:MlaD family protein [Rhodoferax sp.]MDZ7922331.1 MlaD family protein [Rhodoferax sp.]
MENKSHAFAAGAFVLVVAALLAALAAWLTRDTAEQRVFEISSAEGVTGLQPQAGVRFKGVLVGRVTDIALDTVQRGNVLLRIAVNEQAPITQSTFATLGFQGVTGLAFVQLDDKGEQPAALVASGSTPPRIPMRPSMVSRFTEQGGNLLTQMEQASGRVNTLLDVENQKALMGAIQQMGQAAANVSTLARRADQVLGVQADATLKSMQATSERLGASADSVRTSAAEFQRMSRRMNEPGGTLDKIAQSTDALAHTSRQVNAQLLPRLNRATDDTARTLRQVGRAADAVGDSPQSLLWGKGQATPGPGERGFVAPATAAP